MTALGPDLEAPTIGAARSLDRGHGPGPGLLRRALTLGAATVALAVLPVVGPGWGGGTAQAAEPTPGSLSLAAAPGDPSVPRIAAAGGSSKPEPQAASAAPPTYRTRIPPPAQLHYALSRGLLRGVGELSWQPDANGYALRLEGKVPPFGTLITQTSAGRFDAAGLAPLRHTDKRVRRDERAATFERDQGTIRFSGKDATEPLQPGTQDRLSVMVQLAAIAEAWTQPPAAGTVVEMEVVGARGDAHRWALRYDGLQPVTTAGGTTQALKFEREAQGGKETRAEFWLDPQAHHLPVRARLTDGDGDALELLRTPR